jgi:hypothetical protein
MSEFEINLLRMIAAEMWLSNRLQTVFAILAADFQMITPEWLQAQKAGQPLGFQAPVGTAPKS